jgi:hypothetical protein
LVEVVRFFVIYDLARNETGSVKDGMTELYKNDKQKVSYSIPLFLGDYIYNFIKILTVNLTSSF